MAELTPLRPQEEVEVDGGPDLRNEVFRLRILADLSIQLLGNGLADQRARDV